MDRKLVLILVILVLFVCLGYPRLQQNRVNASAGYPVHNVSTGLNYTSIQEAIDATETLDGQTIHVDSGTYYVNNTVDNVINKTLSLVGDGKENTTIIAMSRVSVFYVTSDNVTISGFTLQNGTCGVEAYSDYVRIVNCNISGNDEGIRMYNPYYFDRLLVGEVIEGNVLMNNTMAMRLETCNSTIYRNFVSGNGGGIYLSSSAQGSSLPNGNFVYENTVINSSHVPYIAACSVGGYNNSIFLNNFWDKNVRVNPGSANAWNCSLSPDNLLWGGNFWSDYNQTNEYGLGDVPYVIDANNTDYHPLTGTMNVFDGHYGYEVDIISNSTISNFEFKLINQSNAALSFIVGGEYGTQGFCRVIIPEPLITSHTFAVELDGKAWGSGFYNSNLTHWMTWIYYSHSFHQIKIAGATTVPEFPAFLIPSLLVMATLLAIIIYKRKHLI